MKERPKKSTKDVMNQVKKPSGSNIGNTVGVSNCFSLGGRKFGTVADLSAEDKDLMAYLLSMKSRGGDLLGRYK